MASAVHRTHTAVKAVFSTASEQCATSHPLALATSAVPSMVGAVGQQSTVAKAASPTVRLPPLCPCVARNDLARTTSAALSSDSVAQTTSTAVRDASLTAKPLPRLQEQNIKARIIQQKHPQQMHNHPQQVQQKHQLPENTEHSELDHFTKLSPVKYCNILIV
jgi:hypothetical protein